jgi:hypothetical protein
MSAHPPDFITSRRRPVRTPALHEHSSRSGSHEARPYNAFLTAGHRRGVARPRPNDRPDLLPMSPSAYTTTTLFVSVPMPDTLIAISSPAFSVKSSPGTTPVPVSSTAPCGKVCERKR